MEGLIFGILRYLLCIHVSPSRVWGKSLLACSPSPSPSFSFQTYSHIPCSCTSSQLQGNLHHKLGSAFPKYGNMMKWKRRNIASAITTKTITEITHITCKPHSIDLLIFNAFLHINERKKHYITWNINKTKNNLKRPWMLIGETSSLH